MTAEKKHFIPLESDPALFTELIHTLGVSARLAFHDLLTLSAADGELLAPVPRPALALVLVIPAPDGYVDRIGEEEGDVPVHDKKGDEEDVVFYCQTIGNACGLFATLHAVSNGGARAFVEPNTHIARLIEKCAPLNRAQRIATLESDEQLAAAHASVASRGSTAPPEDAREPAPFAYMTFVKSHKSGLLYQLEGCRKGPVDLGCVLAEDEDMLSEKALDAVRKFVESAGRGIAFGYSAMALSVTAEGNTCLAWNLDLDLDDSDDERGGAFIVLGRDSAELKNLLSVLLPSCLIDEGRASDAVGYVVIVKIEKKSDAHLIALDADGKEWSFRKACLIDTQTSTEMRSIKRMYLPLPVLPMGYEGKGGIVSGCLGGLPGRRSCVGDSYGGERSSAQLNDTIILYTQGNKKLATQQISVASTKFKIEACQIKGPVGSPGAGSVTVEFVDGARKEEKFLVHKPLTSVLGPFIARLSITLTPMGDISADAPAHQTGVQGVFAAGDCIAPYEAVLGAISSDCNFAVAASTQLQSEKYG
ncbi:hypothetical protein F4859DRAFT_511897 [Xylaria cf. heliscus]|nr:hypothetical protein F4859DRAFT_511897 [Xylaria cf. heliscus]